MHMYRIGLMLNLSKSMQNFSLCISTRVTRQSILKQEKRADLPTLIGAYLPGDKLNDTHAWRRNFAILLH